MPASGSNFQCQQIFPSVFFSLKPTGFPKSTLFWNVVSGTNNLVDSFISLPVARLISRFSNFRWLCLEAIFSGNNFFLRRLSSKTNDFPEICHFLKMLMRVTSDPINPFMSTAVTRSIGRIWKLGRLCLKAIFSATNYTFSGFSLKLTIFHKSRLILF